MTNYIERFENYLIAKEDFEQNIILKKQVIILQGSGCNGKTHLTNQCMGLIEDNDYKVTQEVLCGRGVNRLNAWNFERKLNNLHKKTIFHFRFNPFVEWEIEQPENTHLIDMSHISFQN